MKKFFRGSPEHFLDKNAIWDRTPPHLHINCSLHVWGRAQGSQIFKRNSIISIRSKVMTFLVILLSPRGPRGPRVVPVVPTSSLHRPCRLHIIPVVSTSSPHHPRHLQKVPMWSPWSVVSTCCLCRPHIVPVVPTLSPSSPHCLEGLHIILNPQIPTLPNPCPPGGVGAPNQ